MKRPNTAKKRKELENKMAMVFEDETKSLSSAYKKIIFDDLVSAFENRLSALNRTQSHLEFLNITKEELQIETQ